MRHFRVILDEVKCPTGYAGQTTRGCMCCGLVLCGCGGGGLYLCDDCLTKMERGEIAEAISLLERMQGFQPAA